MRFYGLLFAVFAFTFYPALSLAQDRDVPKNKPRKWTDQSGKYELVASIVAYKNGTVSLQKKSDGSVVKIDLKGLQIAVVHPYNARFQW